MRKLSLFLLLLIAFLLAACNGEEPVEEEPAPRATPTIEETEGGETDPAPDDGYPVEPTAAPGAAYPGRPAESWVIRPAGEQCAESVAYPTSDSAVADLEAGGVELLAVEETELTVCEACGCPTSAHYRVLVSSDDVPTALSLGWQLEG